MWNIFRMNLFSAAFLLVTLATVEGYTPVWAATAPRWSNRVSGGTADGDEYYVCRARYAGHKMCGKTRSGGSCIITWNNQCHSVSSYELLITPPHESFKYEWSTSDDSRGSIPTNAVYCGSGSYVGRKIDGNDEYLGKIDRENEALFYDKSDCKEHDTNTYRALRQVSRTISRYEMKNVVYDFAKSVVLDSEPKTAATDTTTNNLDYAVDNTVTLQYSITITNSWGDVKTYSVERGKSLTVTAGTPYVNVAGTIEESESSTHQQTTDEAKSETTTITKDVTVPLRGGETAQVIVWIVERRISVPYTADVTVVYADNGEGKEHSIEGNYIDFTSYETGTEINPIGDNGGNNDGSGAGIEISSSNLLVALLSIFSLGLAFY